MICALCGQRGHGVKRCPYNPFLLGISSVGSNQYAGVPNGAPQTMTGATGGQVTVTSLAGWSRPSTTPMPSSNPGISVSMAPPTALGVPVNFPQNPSSTGQVTGSGTSMDAGAQVDKVQVLSCFEGGLTATSSQPDIKQIFVEVEMKDASSEEEVKSNEHVAKMQKTERIAMDASFEPDKKGGLPAAAEPELYQARCYGSNQLSIYRPGTGSGIKRRRRDGSQNQAHSRRGDKEKEAKKKRSLAPSFLHGRHWPDTRAI